MLGLIACLRITVGSNLGIKKGKSTLPFIFNKYFIRSVTVTVLSIYLLGCFATSNSNSNELEQSLSPDVNCLENPESIAWSELLIRNCNRLSDYGLFEGNDPRINPRESGVEYFISTQLFTDYAKKHRFMFIPDNKKIEYNDHSALSFPMGTVLVKTFVLPDANNQVGVDMIETRLLIRRENGWVGLPYIWNQEKTEAYLSLAGASIEKSMVVDGVGSSFDYQVPSVSDCRTCHIVREKEVSKTEPIGLKTRHLNRNVNTVKGYINQLEYWSERGLLIELPKDLSVLASVPVWGDERRTLQERAKGYLDINCSHCHTPGGSGSESGMFLEYWRSPEYFDHGICKRPGGFNGGDKGLIFDIIPGNAEESLVPYRMSLLASGGDEKGQMPPLARHINHIEGIQLVQDWINSMDSKPCR